MNEKCSEGLAVSRKNMRIAWRVDYGDCPERLEEGIVQIWMGDIEYHEGIPQLVNRKLILDKMDLSFATEPEPQNFRPPDEKELIFSSYGYQGCDVMVVSLESGEVIYYSNAPYQYDEPEGIYPDGSYMAFQMARTEDMAGVGYGIFIYDFTKATE